MNERLQNLLKDMFLINEDRQIHLKNYLHFLNEFKVPIVGDQIVPIGVNKPILKAFNHLQYDGIPTGVYLETIAQSYKKTNTYAYLIYKHFIQRNLSLDTVVLSKTSEDIEVRVGIFKKLIKTNQELLKNHSYVNIIQSRNGDHTIVCKNILTGRITRIHFELAEDFDSEKGQWKLDKIRAYNIDLLILQDAPYIPDGIKWIKALENQLSWVKGKWLIIGTAGRLDEPKQLEYHDFIQELDWRFPQTIYIKGNHHECGLTSKDIRQKLLDYNYNTRSYVNEVLCEWWDDKFEESSN